MRKFLSILLILAVCISLFAGAVQAAGTPEISISSGTAKPGETVSLKVSIKNNPGFAGMKLTVSVPKGWTINSMKFKDGSQYGIFYKEEDGDMVTGVASVVNVENGNLVAAYGEGDITGDGVICWVTCTVPAGETNGAKPVSVEIDKINNSADTATNMKKQFTVKSAAVTVSGGADQQPETQPEETPGGTLDAEQVPVAEFSDVAGNWAEEYILQAAELRLIEGYMGYYRPNDTMTRAEFVTILWRAVGRPAPKGKTTFKDLTQDWYKEAVTWAEENAVVNGMAEGVFAPDGKVTREQLVTILHRLAGAPAGMELMLTGVYDSQYPDSKSVGDWAKNALYWSIYNGIYCGVGSEQVGKTLDPKVPADRAQIAVMIVRYLEMKD